MALDKGTKNTLKKRQPFKQMMLEKLGIYIQKTEIRYVLPMLYKNQLKMDQSP
jgi:hypothetical protein